MQNAKIYLVNLSFYNKKYFKKKHEIGNKFCRTPSFMFIRMQQIARGY